VSKYLKERAVKKNISELSLLYEVSQTLDRSLDLRDVGQTVLQLMAEHTGVLRGSLTLFNRQSKEIRIEAAYGLSKEEREKGKYRPGEGVTGKVIQTGKPVTIKRVAEEPGFLDKTGSRKKKEHKDVSYVCVPIKLEDEVIGTLSADYSYSEERELKEDIRVLSIVASLISQAVKLRQSVYEEKQKLLEENQRLQDELREHFKPANIIGNSKGMHAVYDGIMQVAQSDTTVLIRGESGVGKELVAHATHHNSLRSGKPYIKVNCAALPENIVESELFGHEKGAFTGAVAMRKGRFELAAGGTLFLDEVGDFSPATQVKLLRVLQEKEFERVGGTKTIKSDVRIIAATNRNLEEMVETGEFRQDLYYRLNIFPLYIPPLRERRSDILLLADHFVAKYAKSNHKDIKRISTPAIDMLAAYHWPGNVRELENSIERAVLLSADGVIHGHHLPPSLQTAEESGTVAEGTLQEALDHVEVELIIEALKNARGNCSTAAKALGITDRIMGLRLKRFNIDWKRFRT
jgi:Nif-specific regulatory protein